MDEAVPDIFQEKIEVVRRNSTGVPRMMVINLAVALTDHEYNISGNLFYLWRAPTQEDYINIKVNQTSQPAIPYRMGQGLLTPFHTLLITTPAGQTGDLYLIYGTEAPDLLDIIDNRSALSGDISEVLNQLRGDLTPDTWGAPILVSNVAATQLLAANADRKGLLIEMQITEEGEGIVIGFDNTTTANKYMTSLVGALVANVYDVRFRMNDYRGPLWALATDANHPVMASDW